MNGAGGQARAGAVIDRLRQVTGARSDVALAALFGLGSSVVSTWRARDKVPYEQCVHLALGRGCSLDWLLLGLGAPQLGDPPPADAAVSDGRLKRMLGFLEHWQATHEADEIVWLERTLARTVPEYADWLSGQHQ